MNYAFDAGNEKCANRVKIAEFVNGLILVYPINRSDPLFNLNIKLCILINSAKWYVMIQQRQLRYEQRKFSKFTWINIFFEIHYFLEKNLYELCFFSRSIYWTVSSNQFWNIWFLNQQRLFGMQYWKNRYQNQIRFSVSRDTAMSEHPISKSMCIFNYSIRFRTIRVWASSVSCQL